MARLIDADVCWNRILNGCGTIESAVINTPTIDPVHAAGGTYCKECIYSTQKHIPYDDVYYCKLYRDLMPLNGFCSEGRKADTKNA